VSLEVICLRETDEEPEREVFNGVDITRIKLKHRRGGKLSYVVLYGRFILISGAILALRALKEPFDLVHVHNMPDVLVFSALVPKILGAKVILDLHDPMPELMETIFGFREGSLPVSVLKTVEKWSLRFADAVVTVNATCRDIFAGRSCLPGKITVVMNSPDEEIFQIREHSRPGVAMQNAVRPFVVMYHGSLVERHGLDLAISAVLKLRETIPSIELRIYGRSTPFLTQVMDRVNRSGLSEAVRYFGPKTLEEIVGAISECDVGVIPNRRSIFTEINTPTRIFEYLSQGKPVIAPRTRGILDYFGPDEIVPFELGDVDDLAVKIRYVFKHPEEIANCAKRGQQVYLAHKWSNERLRFVKLVEKLVNPTSPAGRKIESNSVSALETQE
jgi:glycosyltransferase involved in cell wall biosynthesis